MKTVTAGDNLLKELYIKNLAIIEEADISFGKSFNVFTGETGAGKSILINGINSVLGQRVTKDIVRTGCDKAVVTAVFTELSDGICGKLDDLGISHDERQIMLSREINADGGSTARINGRASSVSILKEIGADLVSIHGQHDNQILLSTERHIDILDEFGGLGDRIDDYKKDFHELQSISRRLKRLSIEHKEKLQRTEMLKEAIKEIGEAELSENEDKTVEEELNAAQYTEDIISALSSAHEYLAAEDGAAIELVRNARSELESLSELTPKYDELASRLENVIIELTDISDEIDSFADSVDADPMRLHYLTERMDQIEALKKRYGPELSDVLGLYENASHELDETEDLSEELRQLSEKRTQMLHTVSVKAKELSAMREQAAERFSDAVEKELSFLNMPDVKIRAQLTQGNLTEKGMDSAEFMIAANKGEALKPLSKIASGGELSRIMLALKNVIADEADTLIFDEIDTGVSGKAAQKIAIKLKSVSKNRQVLCVTHLPQLASAADTHLLIEKQSDDTRTYTHVFPLDMEGRKQEIARIMVGENITETALKNAEEMLMNGGE